ncbi:twin-arginine translocase TatA/TatE family subunit [Sphingomonas bacterium]|uniref:twin-arginine translocase TatA/TatE family subunit n=1 Tax=Sphingomonas bacterium TaxID=1895847 RepID=UPI0015764B3A|nr:twin-arginine translocase TatA/TatE family subunit [Sphingomonas bacterium]
MGGLSPIHILIFAVIAILVLGGGRFSNLMGDVAKGVKQFKKGMADEDEDGHKPAARLEAKKSADPAFDRDGAPIREERP